LCANCHSRADNEKWGVETLQKYKKEPCILAQRSNAPDSTNAHLVQLLEILVDKKFEEMLERSAEFASMIAAYTKSPGQVKIQSVEPANSCRVVVQLPERAAQTFLHGADAHDPELRMFLDDIDLLSVHLSPESGATAMQT